MPFRGAAQVLGGQVPLPPELLPLYRDIEARASEAQVCSGATGGQLAPLQVRCCQGWR